MNSKKINPPIITNDRRIVRNDLLLIGGVLLAAMIAAALLFLRPAGDWVTVTVDGVPYGTFSLSLDREVEIVTENGRNLLVIRDGRAYVSSADCPDGFCADHRPIFRDGESIVCLPHRVVITVESENETDIDIVA